MRIPISIHAPLAGSDCGIGRVLYGAVISIHAPLAGSDRGLEACGLFRVISIHAPPLAVSDSIQAEDEQAAEFQSTLPLRGATPLQAVRLGALGISIHAPLAGSDHGVHRGLLPLRHFNPRSPCGERRGRKRVTTCTVYFNPRSPCGERRKPTGNRKCNRNFNPRSPCGERPSLGPDAPCPSGFQSTLPLRGATHRRTSCK